MLSRILQSNATIFSDGSFEVELTRVRLPVGRGRPQQPRLPVGRTTFKEFCSRRRGLAYINNVDNLCLPRALVVARAGVNDANFKDMVSNVNNIQTIKARKLVSKSGVIVPDEGCGIPEMRVLQQYLRKYNITVYEHKTRGRSVIFEGVKDSKLPRLNILHHDGHYSVIRSLTVAFTCDYYCEQCHTPYSGRGTHRCNGSCPCCYSAPPCSKVKLLEELSCRLCARGFRGAFCFENHRTNGTCDNFKRCKKCFISTRSGGRGHECGEVYCKMCRTRKPRDHRCYMQVNNSTPDKKHLFIFFDFETRQELTTASGDRVHEVNLCVAQQVCYACQDSDNFRGHCTVCGVREWVFNRRNPVGEFLSYVNLPRRSFKTVTCIAHNGQGFDFQFLLKHMCESLEWTPSVIMRGSKIILIENGKLRFVDSLSYIPMALAKFPDSFDLPGEIKKGYFPHLFNTAANANYNGPIPPVEYYAHDSMFEKDRAKFMQWHAEKVNTGYVFNMQREMVEYCRSDVDILRRACMKFRGFFMTECGVDPFTEAVTIASACNVVFRRRFLTPETIGIVPRDGYRMRDNQSKIALQWLVLQERERGIIIRHAGREREATVAGNLVVDGFHEATNTVFEFSGCFYHGHDICFPANRDNKLNDDPTDTMHERYQRTMCKLAKLRTRGYHIVHVWECEFRRILKENPETRCFVEDHPLIATLPLNPRDAFTGGRTGCTKLYSRADGDCQIKYVDVCSLYPWVCKYGKYPIGHPTVYVASECCTIVGPDNDISAVEGLIKCTVLPPCDLYHPVLPLRANGKLMFALCRVCCEEMRQTDCAHNEQQRAMTGTWVSDEVKKAVQMGYRITAVYEIWQYETVQYDAVTKTGGLFAGYIDTFLRMKQEASGFPVECNHYDEDIAALLRRGYVKSYLRREGVQLDEAAIVKNAGRRSLAKLMLNSFWGKFGQRENQAKTQVVKTHEELYNLLTNPNIVVNHLIPAGERIVYVNWEFADASSECMPTVNVLIAAYTTCQARLKLYEYLQALDRRVLYYDTDSVIYTHSAGQYEPPTGNYLGDLTDELEVYGAGSHIGQFVCAGPKNYAYTVRTGAGAVKTVCKVKGITLNFKNSQTINFNLLKEFVLKSDTDNSADGVVISSDNIRRCTGHDVVTRTETKTFNVVFTKRRRVNDFDSIPYGFKRAKPLGNT